MKYSKFLLSFQILVFALGTEGCGSADPAPPTYTVIYHANTGTGAVPIDANRYLEGATVPVLNAGTLSFPGSYFSTWNTQADGNGTNRAPASTFLMGPANVSLYAKWLPNPTYTISYNGNGSTSGTVPSDGTHYDPGATATVLANTGNLTKINVSGVSYRFDGWNLASDGSGLDFSPAATLTIGSTNLILYAKWTPYALRDIGPAGGHIFYDAGSYSGSPSWRYLEAAPASTEWVNKTWGANGTWVGGTVGNIGSGQLNTTLAVAWLNSNGESDCAAQLCDGLAFGGYSDWFLPSLSELNQIYLNLKLQDIGDFNSYIYWSSTEYAGYSQYSWIEFFCCGAGGSQANGNKGNTYAVRAIRAF